MSWFLKRYQCVCGETWEDEWSCACNDRCPSCNKEIETDDYDDLSVIVEARKAGEECGDKDAEVYVILRSSPDASDKPDYEVIAAFLVSEFTRGWVEYAAQMIRPYAPDELSQEEAGDMIGEQVIDKCRRRGVNTRIDPAPAAG